MTLFLTVEQVIDVHERVLERTGMGSPGLRDENLLRLPVQRPEDKVYYESGSTLPELAASLAYGLAKNHAFIDANKRTTALGLELFLDINGQALDADDDEFFDVIIALASDRVSKADLALWIEAHLTPLEDGDLPV